jgi:peptidoglycan hydrolase-like protein with peptidoglycan-binding domain
LIDPFIRASSYPATDPFATTTSKPAPSVPAPTPAPTPAPKPPPTSTANTSSGSSRTNPAPTPVLQHPLLAPVEQLQTVARGKTLLRRGDQGAGVRALQQVLLNAGFQLPSGADGIFDESMHHAVQAFQRKHGLKDDGIIGSITIRKLDAIDSTESAN